MVNTPIPHSLKSEAKKAAKILRDFTVPTAKMGPDKLIPAGIFMKAKGLAILTVVKAGFLVTARGGSGIVIAKVGDGIDSKWSAPSAIGIAGLGGGFEIGAEVTDFVIILNKRSAVDAFSKGGNLTLGGNFTIAAGPLGRNLEADVALRSTAAIYTYSKTRGLFAGISVEGSGLIERKDANKKFYGHDIRAFEILRGDVQQPPECVCLYDMLDSHRKKAEKEMIRMAKTEALKHASAQSEKLGISDKLGSFTPSFMKSKKKKSSGKGGHSPGQDYDYDSDSPEPSPQPSRHVTRISKSTKTVTKKSKSSSAVSASSATTSTVAKSNRSQVGRRNMHSQQPTEVRTTRPRSASGASNFSAESSDDSLCEIKATAVYPFEGQVSCDLSFKPGDTILVLTYTDKQNDWWEGWCRGKTGIFPANFVKVNK